MKALPKPDKRSKIGTSLRGKLLSAHRSINYVTHYLGYERQSRAFRQEFRKLISKTDLRVAAEIIARATQEWKRSNLKLGGEAAKWHANKSRFRKLVARELERAISGYPKWQQLAQSHRREHQKLSKANLAVLNDKNVHVDFGDVLPPDIGTVMHFTPPFSVHDVHNIPHPNAVAEDASFAVPANGHVINNIAYKQEDDGPIFTDIWGIDWPALYRSSAACGTNYTTPVMGRIKIDARIQNFHSRASIELEDCFGFSQSEAELRVMLFIAIDSPNAVIEATRVILSDGYNSFGSDEIYSVPALDSSVPYVVSTTTNEVFPANTGMRILAGAKVQILSEVDDMKAYVKILHWWQVQQIDVQVV